jgi:hypothetical protein
MAKVRLSVSVGDSHVSDLGKVAKAAKKAGMKVDQQLDAIGVLTGSIDASKLESLHRIEGISHIEKEREVGIAPPGSPVQ